MTAEDSPAGATEGNVVRRDDRASKLARAIIKSARSGDLESARKRAVRYAELAPVDRASIAHALKVCSIAGYWEGVLRYAERLDPIWRDDADVLNAVAKAERELGWLEQSIVHYRASIALEDTPAKRHEMALALLAYGKSEEAIECWRKLAADEPASRRWIIYLVRAYDISGDLEQAEQTLHEALARYPADDEFLHRYGAIQLKRQDFAKASMAFAEAAELKPDEGKYVRDLLRAAAKLFDETLIEGAIRHGEQYASRHLDTEIAAFTVKLLSKLPSGEDVAIRLDAIAEKYPSEPQVLRALAPAFVRGGRLDRARLVLERHLELEPDNRDVLYGLAGVLAQQSHAEAALRLLLAHGPEQEDDPIFPARIGHLLTWSRKPDEAMPWLQKAVRLDPVNPQPFADLCNCYEQQEKFGSAAVVLNQSLALSLASLRKPVLGFAEADTRLLQTKARMVALTVGETGRARALLRETHRSEPFAAPFPVTDWDGEPLEGKTVLAVAGAGIGDEIRALSVFHRLFEGRTKVSMTCEPRLESLLRRSFPEFRFYPVTRPFGRLKQPQVDIRTLALNTFTRRHLSDAAIAAGEDADYWIRLPYAFNLQILDNPQTCLSMDMAALHPEPEVKRFYADSVRRAVGDVPLIGLSWRSGHRAYNRDQLYFAIQDLEPLFDLQEAHFTIINYTCDAEELDFLRSRLGSRLVEFPELDMMDDFEGVAALSSVLDLAVCVDTSVLDLAASVGTPTLYLMRAPLIVQRYRMLGTRGPDGTFADRVWPTCRILPRGPSGDSGMMEDARRIIAARLGLGATATGPAAR
ncbi:tetratricopeptide repeat protein [Mesorhizobium yinganensis]|uniref:tetratricopeptide repeat protein n=1 Tax=Mesorhizobium yinganensis TaxID=3157707 RepID=UPI0032B78DEF